MDRARQATLVMALVVPILAAQTPVATAQTQIGPPDDIDVLGVRADQPTEVLFAAPTRSMEQLTDDDLTVTVDGEPASTRLERLPAADLDLVVVIDTTVPTNELRMIQGAVVQLALGLPQGTTMRVADARGNVSSPAAVPGPAIAQIRQVVANDPDDLQRAVIDSASALDGAGPDHSALLVIGRDLGRRLEPIDDQPFGRLVYTVDIGARASSSAPVGPGTAGRSTTVDDVRSVLAATDKIANDVRNLYRATVDVPDDARTITLRIPRARGNDLTQTVALTPDDERPAEAEPPANPAPDAGADGGTVDDTTATSPSLRTVSADLVRSVGIPVAILGAALILVLLARPLTRTWRQRLQIRRRQRKALAAADPAPSPGPAPSTPPLQRADDDSDAPPPRADGGTDAPLRVDGGMDAPLRVDGGRHAPPLRADTGSDRMGTPADAAGEARPRSRDRSAPTSRPIAKLSSRTREALAHAHLGLRRLALASRAAAGNVPDDLFRLAEARASVALSRQDLDLREVLTGALVDDDDADIGLVRRSADALATGWRHTSNRSSSPPPVIEINAVLTGRAASGDARGPQRPVAPVRALNPLVEIGLEHIVLAGRSDRDSPLVARAVMAVDIMRAARLARPVLVISPWVLDDRGRYYGALASDLEDAQQRDRWLEFLCDCIADGATESADRLTKLDRLRTRYRQRTADPRVLPLIDVLLAQPIVDASMVARRLSTSPGTAIELLSTVSDIGLLERDHERPGTWVADQVLALFTDMTNVRERNSQPA